MNQRLVESVAQTILAMSDEERQLLDSKLQEAGCSSQVSRYPETTKSARVSEIAKDIQSFEDKYHPERVINEYSTQNGNGSSTTVEANESSTLQNAFLRTASSLNLEGPEDFSINVDHYLYGLQKQDA